MAHVSRTISLAVIAAVFLPQSAFGITMQSAEFQIDGSSFGSGGAAESASENYLQTGTLGEALIGKAIVSDSFQSDAGFAEVAAQEADTSAAEPSTPAAAGAESSGGSGGRRSSTQNQSPETMPDGGVPTDTGTAPVMVPPSGAGSGGATTSDDTSPLAPLFDVFITPGDSEAAYPHYWFLIVGLLVLTLFLFWLLYKRRKDKEEDE